MSEIRKETRKDALRRLFEQNGLVQEDVYKDKRGFVIITRTGIERAKSRAVLMMTGFYEQGIYGQDEMMD